MTIRYAILGIMALLWLGSCKGDVLPKPKAMLRLDYAPQAYQNFESECPFHFEYNTLAAIDDKGDCNLVIVYPEMKGSVFLSYKPVQGNLNSLLKDAEKLAYEHVVKADAIPEQLFVNEDAGVYGMYYEVSGDAASQAQFYLTDSTRHFLAGSLYFEARPNYDSILPAAAYLREDIRRLMESLDWNQ